MQSQKSKIRTLLVSFSFSLSIKNYLNAIGHTALLCIAVIIINVIINVLQYHSIIYAYRIILYRSLFVIYVYCDNSFDN